MTGVNSCIVSVPIGMSRQDYFIHMQIPNWVGTMRKCGPNVIKFARMLATFHTRLLVEMMIIDY